MNPAFDLREPVVIVTSAGRKRFTSSYGLMQEIQDCDGDLVRVLQLSEGERAATDRSLGAINVYLRAFGLRQIRRQQGPGVWFSRYGWAAFKEAVGIEFEARNVVVARLPAGAYFGAPLHPALLVAAWDGSFDNLRAATR